MPDQLPLFELQDPKDEEISFLKRQLQEARETIFRKSLRIGELEEELQKDRADLNYLRNQRSLP